MTQGNYGHQTKKNLSIEIGAMSGRFIGRI